MSAHEQETDPLVGRCPTCDGRATVYRLPDEDSRGHIYCQQDKCGWAHRNVAAINRYIESCPQS